LVLERDRLPPFAARRAGVAQGGQLHNLLSAGVESIEALLPGFCRQVTEAGGVRANVSLDTRVWGFGRWTPQRDLGLTLLCASRPVMEHALRTLASSAANVTIRDGLRVEDVAIDERGRACGVVARAENGARETISAELVIDASAGGFNTLKW